MIGIFSGPSGSGGGGGVTDFTVTSQSLANSTVPNPIVGTGGVVQLEVQIIYDTVTNLQAMQAAGTLLKGVTYGIRNWNKAIGNGKVLLGAHFLAVKDASAGGIVLAKQGHAYTATGNYIVSYDLINNEIHELIFPNLNQRASRASAFLSNNIESLPWEDPACTDFRDVNSNYSQLPFSGRNIIINSEILYSTIDWGNSNKPFLSGSIIHRSTIALLNSANPGSLTDCTVRAGCLLTVEGPMIRVLAEEGCSFAVGNAVTVADSLLQQGFALPLNSGVALTSGIRNTTLNNVLQSFTPTAGATDTVADSYNSIINVHLEPAGIIPTYTLELPANPTDNMVINIMSTDDITTFTLGIAGGGGTPILQPPGTLRKFVRLSYIFYGGAYISI